MFTALNTRNYGKSQALHAAFEKVQGDVVITMDADFYKIFQKKF